MKNTIIILLLSLLFSCNNTPKVAVPSFQLDVQFSEELKENVTIKVIISTIPKDQSKNFTNSDRVTLATKTIQLDKSTILNLDDLLVDAKYIKQLDNLDVLINAYPTEEKDEFYVEDIMEKTIKELKSKKTTYKLHIIRT